MIQASHSPSVDLINSKMETKSAPLKNDTKSADQDHFKCEVEGCGSYFQHQSDLVLPQGLYSRSEDFESKN